MKINGSRGVDALIFEIRHKMTITFFFQDILFPYAKKNVKVFLERNWGPTQCTEDIEALRNQVS